MSVPKKEGSRKKNQKKKGGMTTVIKADVQLDARELKCPMTLLKTKRAMEKMASGQVIEVLGTDPGSRKDLSDFAKKSGHELLSVEADPGGFDRYYLRKG